MPELWKSFMLIGLGIFGYGFATKNRVAELVGVVIMALEGWAYVKHLESYLPANPSPFGNFLWMAP